MGKAILIYSGGPDSTAVAMWAVEQGFDLELLTLQIEESGLSTELKSSKVISKQLGLKQTVVNYGGVMEAFNPNARPLMHIGIAKEVNQKNRPHLLKFGAGMILSFAAVYALYNNVNNLFWGATEDDHYLNAEYSQSFADSMAKQIENVTRERVNIKVPFSSKRKYQVFSQYKDREDLFAQTWSCLNTSFEEQCGECKACVMRRVAALQASIEDITQYSGRNLDQIVNLDDFDKKSGKAWNDLIEVSNSYI